MNFIKRFWNWGWGIFFAHQEVFMYLIFGGLTTLVNWVTYYALGFASGWSIHYQILNVIAWVAAVAFAYITNRLWVFSEKAHGARAVLLEIGMFVAARLASLGAEAALLWVLVDLVHISELWAKIPTAFLVIVLNYIFSKLFIFKNRGTTDAAAEDTPQA